MRCNGRELHSKRNRRATTIRSFVVMTAVATMLAGTVAARAASPAETRIRAEARRALGYWMDRDEAALRARALVILLKCLDLDDGSKMMDDCARLDAVDPDPGVLAGLAGLEQVPSHHLVQLRHHPRVERRYDQLLEEFRRSHHRAAATDRDDGRADDACVDVQRTAPGVE